MTIRIIQIFLLYFIILKIIKADNECTYNKYYLCNSPQINEWDSRCFQTPKRSNTSNDYLETYQDMHYLVGYARLLYSSNKTICNITFITKVNPELGTYGDNYKILYSFGIIEQETNYIILTPENGTYPNGLSISAKIVDINNSEILAKLQLEDEYLIWDNEKINQNEYIYKKGQKGSIVELFGWPYNDIAEECDFLRVAGYLGVKISPPNEYILTTNVIENGELNPWEYFHQTVSYKLNKTRLGSKKELKNMINRCRHNNIRIYSQIVINQMTHNGNDVYSKHYNEDENCSENLLWVSKSSSGGSPFFTIKGRKKETGKIPVFEYPSVPYCGTDIHCQDVSSDVSHIDVKWVGGEDGLIDLNTSKPYVQQRIADFLTELLSVGFSGFSIYTSKYISTDDYKDILLKLKSNLGNDEDFPDDFIIIFEMAFDNDNEKKEIMCNND